MINIIFKKNMNNKINTKVHKSKLFQKIEIEVLIQIIYFKEKNFTYLLIYIN